MKHFRNWFLLALALAVGGCATEFKPYEPPVDTPLQDPPPGRAVVYLIRLPYDGLSVALKSNETRLAKLPPGTYTALALRPGRYSLVTTSTGMFDGNKEAAPALHLDLLEGQRKFYYLSGAMRQSATVAGVIPGAIPVPILVPSMGTQGGSHAWKETSQRDAQGLLSNASVVLPDGPGSQSP